MSQNACLYSRECTFCTCISMVNSVGYRKCHKTESYVMLQSTMHFSYNLVNMGKRSLHEYDQWKILQRNVKKRWKAYKLCSYLCLLWLWTSFVLRSSFLFTAENKHFWSPVSVIQFIVINTIRPPKFSWNHWWCLTLHPVICVIKP